jgi:hypothetical protein
MWVSAGCQVTQQDQQRNCKVLATNCFMRKMNCTFLSFSEIFGGLQKLAWTQASMGVCHSCCWAPREGQGRSSFKSTYVPTVITSHSGLRGRYFACFQYISHQSSNSSVLILHNGSFDFKTRCLNRNIYLLKSLSHSCLRGKDFSRFRYFTPVNRPKSLKWPTGSPEMISEISGTLNRDVHVSFIGRPLATVSLFNNLLLGSGILLKLWNLEFRTH